MHRTGWPVSLLERDLCGSAFLSSGVEIYRAFIARKFEGISTMIVETTATMQSNAETAADIEKIARELSAVVKCFRC